MTLWCRATVLNDDGSPADHLAMEGVGAPDLGAVDGLARWMLDARRAGRRVVVERIAAEMAELLDLAGLGVEMQGQAEGGEEPHGVQRVEKEG